MARKIHTSRLRRVVDSVLSWPSGKTCVASLLFAALLLPWFKVKYVGAVVPVASALLVLGNVVPALQSAASSLATMLSLLGLVKVHSPTSDTPYLQSSSPPSV
jgi:hypothetical protein